MSYLWILILLVGLALLLLSLAVRIVKQYEQGVLFRLGRVIGVRKAGLTVIIPVVDVLHRVSLRIVPGVEGGSGGDGCPGPNGKPLAATAT